jgi:cbb3-type cytochrome oxidase maturation protein
LDILYLLIPFSALLVLAILAVFAWAVRGGQFDDLGAGERILKHPLMCVNQRRCRNEQSELGKGLIDGRRSAAAGPHIPMIGAMVRLAAVCGAWWACWWAGDRLAAGWPNSTGIRGELDGLRPHAMR